MAGINKIKGVSVATNHTNSSHTTTDDLKCDVCGKKVKSVMVLTESEGEIIHFACDKCFMKLLEEMLIQCKGEYLMMCEITDIHFPNKKETKKRVRSEMTLKLRYRIMKRDNFKCVICGKSMPEVELCVDHIKPVAKGGLSVEDNLRTLCNKCNAGKGDEWQM